MTSTSDKIKKLVRINKRKNSIKKALPILMNIFGENFTEREIEDYDFKIDIIEQYWSQFHQAEKGEVVSLQSEWDDKDFRKSLIFVKNLLKENEYLSVKILLNSEEIGIINSTIIAFLPHIDSLINLDNHGINIFEPLSGSGLCFSRHSYHWAEKKITYKWHLTSWGNFMSDVNL